MGYVNDYANLLTPNEKHHMDWLLKTFSRESRTDTIIIIVKDSGDLTPEQYAYWLFNCWKLRRLGRTGFLILVSLKERRVETEIGFGFEKIFSEADAENLLDHILIPHFKKGWYGSGLLHAVRELTKSLYQKTGMAHA